MGAGDQLGTIQPPGEVQWGRQGSSFGQQAVLALLNFKWKGLRHPSCSGNTCFQPAGETGGEDPGGSGEGADFNGAERQE